MKDAPNQGTVSRIVKMKTKLTSLPQTANLKVKSLWDPLVTKLEEALFVWLNDQTAKGTQINGPVLCLQAERLRAVANVLLPGDAKISLQFSHGWLDRFQKHHNVKLRRVHGEALSAYESGLAHALPLIIEKIAQYSP